MKIIELQASNFARLRAVEIRPDGALVPIVGKNRQGKTSVLKAIWAAFQGRSVAPARSIRDGAEEARLQVQIGGTDVELTILRTIKRNPDSGEEEWALKVTQADGGRVTRKPQELINGSLDALAFDPLAFARAAPKDQLAQLKALVPGFDFTVAASRRARLFDERTEANRKAKAEHAIVSGFRLPPGPEPAAVDSAGLVKQMQVASARAQERQAIQNRFASLELDGNRLMDEAEKLHARATTLENQARAAFDEAAALTLPDEIDTAEIVAKLASAQEVQRARQLHADRRLHAAAADGAEGLAADLTEQIDALDNSVRAAVEAAKLPAGLTMTEDGVLLDGVPFEQAATSEKILASAQVRMALAPDLRVMLIDEGSELDSELLKLLENLAEAHSYQVWICKVSEDGQSPGFIIEDGSVRHAERPAEGKSKSVA